ncbi:MAG: cytochrome c [Cytophagales bacterium]|nr:cytochrome c [Cytophagales bacterium]
MNRLLAVVLLAISLQSCYTKKLSEYQPVTCDTTQVTFTNQVQPILNANCVVCHKTGGSGPFSLEQYADAKSNATNVLHAIKHDAGYSPMPKGGGKLSDCDISVIQRWINLNYPN